MSEYIGSRISLISKSDIRYVGTLVEINSEQSTVALEDVRSFGTEGRRSGGDEIPPSAAPYEYIIFRGSDVKDLRIEETPKETKPAPQVPNDPAILGSARPPPQRPPQQPTQQPPGPGFPQQPPFGQYPPYHPANQGFGRGFPGGPGGPGPGPQGFPNMPYGAPPPGWYPGPNQGFPPHGPMGGQLPQAPGQAAPQQAAAKSPQPSPEASAPSQQQKPEPSPQKPQDTAKTASPAPPPPVESKPDVAAALAPPPTAPTQAAKPPTQPRGRVMPAIPRPAKLPTQPAAAASAPGAAPPTKPASTAQSYQNATEAATAAVAAAMAKLPARQKAETSEAMDNLTRKVNEMRTDDNIRHSRQQGTGGYAAGYRGRGGRRGGHPITKPMEIPTTDYDFESANAKFNKQDLAKEVIASGSPVQTPGGANGADAAETNGDSINGIGKGKAEEDVVIPPAAPAYDSKSSFFDNISSELKGRDETTGRKIGGPEFRTEERKRNMETFGQGSVDNYRGGFRGRGRGRGFRGRGGFGGRGRGGYRGGRGNGPNVGSGTTTIDAGGS